MVRVIVTCGGGGGFCFDILFFFFVSSILYNLQSIRDYGYEDVVALVAGGEGVVVLLHLSVEIICNFHNY